MANNGIPTFIITSQIEDGFIKYIYSSPDSQFINTANLIVLPNAKVFRMLYDSFDNGSKFRLLIHPKMKDSGDIESGERIIHSLDDIAIKNIPFITRAISIREKCKEEDKNFITKSDGYTYFDATRIDRDDYIADIPIFQKSADIQPKVDNIETRNEFAILTALYEDECTSFKDNMDFKEIAESKNTYIGKHLKLQDNLDYMDNFIFINQDKMGVVDAASFATNIIVAHKPKFLIMGGVCGGRKSKGVSIYDIIIPSKIFDYITGKLENGEFISYNHNSSTNENLINYIKRIKSDIKANMLKLSRHDKKSIVENVKIHIGDFTCGPWVVKTSEFMESELAVEEKKNILGLEMESLSILRASENFQKSGNYSLVVKSVMDYTDDKKSDGIDGSIKSTAAYISYLCIRSLMPYLLKFSDTNL